MHITEVETHKANKIHRCEWCWQNIEPATEYKRYRYYNGGDAGTVRMHPECYCAMQDYAYEEGGYIEWTPGQERPPSHNAQVKANGALMLNQGTAGCSASPATEKEDDLG